MTTQNMIKEMTTTDPLVSLPDEHPITGDMGTEMVTTNPFGVLPVEIFESALSAAYGLRAVMMTPY